MSNLRGRDHPEDEIMRAFANYLEIVESGGNGEAFLRRDATMEPELRALAGLDAKLRVEVPEQVFAGQARSFRQFRDAIKDEDTSVRALAWFRPRLFGILGALGLGMGLSAAFASGALPSEKLTNIFGSLPIIGSSSVSTTTPDYELVSPLIIDRPAPSQHSDIPSVGNPGAVPTAPGLRLGTDPEGAQTENPDFEVPTPSVGQSGQPSEIRDEVIGSNSSIPVQNASGPGSPPAQVTENQGRGIEPEAPPAGQAIETTDESNGLEESAPGQGGENPGNGGSNGNDVGQGGTPPGQSDGNPGQGNGGTPPGQGDGNNPGQGNGGTPPGQGDGNNPGQGNGGTPPGQDDSNPGQGNGGTPPGQSDGNPGQGNDGTPPGQSDGNPGQGNDGTPPGQSDGNPGQGNDGTPPGQSDGNNPGQGNGGTPPGQTDGNPGQGNGGTPPGQGNGNPGQGNDGTPPGQGNGNRP